MTREEWEAFRDERLRRLEKITPPGNLAQAMEADRLEREIRIAERYIRRKGK